MAIGVSTSSSSDSAGGATQFGPVTITNGVGGSTGSGSSSTYIYIGLALLALWIFLKHK